MPRVPLPTSITDLASTGTPPNDHLTEIRDEMRTSANALAAYTKAAGLGLAVAMPLVAPAALGGSMLKLNALP